MTRLARFLTRLDDWFADRILSETVPCSPVSCAPVAGRCEVAGLAAATARPATPPHYCKRGHAMNVEELAAAARRGAVALATDPAMRHYSPDTIALVFEQTVVNLAGAGSLTKVAERMANDPKLEGVPIGVIEEVMAASVMHLARALPAEAAR